MIFMLYKLSADRLENKFKVIVNKQQFWLLKIIEVLIKYQK